MKDNFYLAWQYIRHHPSTTVVLIVAITLICFLPAALQVIANNAEEHLRGRADSTPLVVGPKGSALELTLSSVYFDQPLPEVLRMSEVDRLAEQNLGLAIPLHGRFEARGFPIIGTTAKYASFRELRLSQGRMSNMLGECVVGASVAEKLDLSLGAKIPVDTSTAFVLKDAPLRLHVVGILASTETPDDEAILVDLETTWVIEGLGHGHASGAQHGSADAILYTDITNENVNSFHFHGNRDQFPITAIIVVPSSKKDETLLLGQYLSLESTTQITRPPEVINALLEKIFMIRSYMISTVAAVSLVTVSTLILVIVLSIRLRQNELTTMFKIGCSRYAIVSIIGCQMVIILCVSFLCASALTFITDMYGGQLVRLLVL